ncbi:MAG: ATP synthase F1 subunit gamma [Fibrobacter sp.]|nr:ATP synthase F1 subunit gamma [Fibrobacter sp.]
MASISELRKQIKGIKSTSKITRAMKMVAGARFNKAQIAMQNSRTFYNEVFSTFSQLVVSAQPSQKVFRHITFDTKPFPLPKVGLVIITGDKGLCGDFNSSVIREAEKILKNPDSHISCVFTIGRKGCDYFRKSINLQIIEYPNVFNNLEYAFSDKLGTEILKKFDDEHLTSVVVVSAHFKSMIKKEVLKTTLLPLFIDKSIKSTGCMYEPEDEDELLVSTLPFVVNASIYKLMRESYVAEIAQRMRAMDNATTNAGTLIEKITLEMNKVRQGNITRELAEIIGTNEVIK